MERKKHQADESLCQHIQVQKNKTLRSMIECNICYSSYDAQDHIPLALSCQHNICSSTVDRLFKNNKILCPFCKKSSHYESKTVIPKNYTMIEIINILENTQVQIQISLSDDVKMFESI